ncbi:MAG: MFS transporter [Rhodospirillales bacterium]|nr:MFS transporter [Rhodospirillales bacterium]
MLSLLFLGFSSGLPFGVLAEPLTARLVEADLSKTAIGLFALVSLPYSLKFVWAPLMDHVRLPVLSALLGRRRAWVIATQVLLFAAILALGVPDPKAVPWTVAALALLVAFASASQDIVVDAYRVEVLDDRRYAAGAATAVFGWRVGQLASAAGGLVLADLVPWETAFLAMAAAVGVGVVAILVNPEPAAPAKIAAEPPASFENAWLARRIPEGAKTLRAFAGALYVAAIAPLADFTRREGWVAILAFILLYKFGDQVLAVMKMPFFLGTIGFTKTEIAEVVKVFGVAAILGGGFLGGILLARMGLMKGLFVCGILMAASNLVFVVQAWVGRDLAMLALAIAVENVTTGMGTAAFVAYLSSLCNVAYTATQYALLTSLMAFSRTVMSSGAGWLADRMDWASFFVLSTLAALPGLILLWWMIRRWPPKG